MQIQISWLLQKPSDLDLHCLQRQGISGFSRTRVNSFDWAVKLQPKQTNSAYFSSVYSSFLQVNTKYLDQNLTISSLQTNTDTFRNRTDPDETACLPFSYWFSYLTETTICNNRCVQIQRLKSPLKKFGAERVNRLTWAFTVYICSEKVLNLPT